MGPNYSIIGMKLKQARIDKKITQEKLAELLDVSVAYVSRVERGSTELSLKRLIQICNLLEISTGCILDDVIPTSNSYLNVAFSDLLKNCPQSELRDDLFRITYRASSRSNKLRNMLNDSQIVVE